MAHLSGAQLKHILDHAKSQIVVGGKYYHYKNPDKLYTVNDIVIIEATDEPGVVYTAESDDIAGVTFVRPLSEFLSEVEIDGEVKNRFTHVE
jgi:hypothetical protein